MGVITTDVGIQPSGDAVARQQQCYSARPRDDYEADTEYSGRMSHVTHETRTICDTIPRGH